MIVYIVLSCLLLTNILLSHYDKIKKFIGFLKLKIIKPKFKIKEKVLISGHQYEVCDILKHDASYVYMCFSLNTNSNILSKYTGTLYYFYEPELKKMPKVLKGL